MNRARVEIKVGSPSGRIKWRAAGAVYDLDDGTRHVDVNELSVNGEVVEFNQAHPNVKQELRDALIQQAVADESETEVRTGNRCSCGGGEDGKAS